MSPRGFSHTLGDVSCENCVKVSSSWEGNGKTRRCYLGWEGTDYWQCCDCARDTGSWSAAKYERNVCSDCKQGDFTGYSDEEEGEEEEEEEEEDDDDDDDNEEEELRSYVHEPESKKRPAGSPAYEPASKRAAAGATAPSSAGTCTIM
jgi:hypothetical protein